MPQQPRPANLSQLVERFSKDLAAIVAAQVEAEVTAQLAVKMGRVKLPAIGASSGSPVALSRADGRRGGRLCPVAGCGKPGAGPRNRWFCKEHSEKLSPEEQKSILARNRRLAAEGKLPTAVPAQRIVRLPPKAPRARKPLDMSCRVEGCPNRSRGPRAGFICDTHRAQLSTDEQKLARDAWNARNKKPEVAEAVERPSQPPAPVPPIVRKAEG